MPWIGNAPEFLVFCGDAHRLERIGELRGHANENGKLEGFFNAAIDAALVLQTFILAAETAGLGCCPISVIRNHADAVADILGLPRQGIPGSRAVCRLSRRRRTRQHAPSARGDRAHGPL